MVPPTGPLDAKIVIVGEAPGEEEVRLGVPFVGSSGKLLNQMLSSAGIERQLCYLTNTCKIRPPNNDFGIFYVDKKRSIPSDLLKTQLDILRAELLALKPNVIICAGAEALRAVTGRRDITHWRGSILASPYGKVVPILHPAYTLRMYGSRPITELDLRRAREESASSDLVLPEKRFSVDPKFEEVCEYLERDYKRIAFDIETTQIEKGKVLVRCLGLSGANNEAICIPFVKSIQTTGLNYAGKVLIAGPANGTEQCSAWSPEQEYQIVSRLDKMFRSNSVEKVAQNMGFDVPILAKEFGFSFASLVQDTMLAHHTCYCELPKGLDFLTSIYTRTPYYSDYDCSDDRQTWIYNCQDASCTYEISQRLDHEMAEMGVADYYYSIKHPAALALVRAETRGIKIDEVERGRRTTEARSKRDELEISIRQHVGDATFNCRSDTQIKKYLYETLRLQPIYKTDPKSKERRPTSDKHAREQLRYKYPEHTRILDLLSDHSVVDTLLTNFLEKPVGGDGRLRTHYNAAGTDTDRLSSREPLFDIGTNLQNIPKGAFRRMFVSDPGWLLIKADLSQAEFRIVVWMAKIHRLIKRYQDDPNFDVHTWVASLIFKKPESEVEKKRDDGKLSERDIAKNGVYGGNYNMQAKKAALVYKMPIEQAEFVLSAYRKAIPEVPLWWERVKSDINATRKTTNPLGRVRLWFDRLDDELYRTAYSDSAQSVVAGVINRAFALADEAFDETECFPVLQVHDEIVCQVREGMEKEYAGKIKKLMEYPLHFPGVDTPLIIPADVSIGKNWFDQEKVK